MNKTNRERREKVAKWFKRVAALLAAAALLLAATPPGREFWAGMYRRSGFSGPPEEALLRIHVIDVGKADAILLECGGETALLDAGTYPRGDTVVDYLLRVGVKSLDYVIPSHPDSDHIGGMAQVLREVPTGEVLSSPWPAALCQGEEYAQLLEASQEALVPWRQLEVGETFSLGEARLEVLGPLEDYGESNDCSLVLRLDCRGFSALFCGDIEYQAEKDLVKSGQNLRADLLKVPHHGSAGSCSPRFLEAVSPRYAAVSTGPDNSRLPRAETLQRLEDAGAQIFRTDAEGDLVFSWNGKELTLWTERRRDKALERALDKTLDKLERTEIS